MIINNLNVNQPQASKQLSSGWENVFVSFYSATTPHLWEDVSSARYEYDCQQQTSNVSSAMVLALKYNYFFSPNVGKIINGREQS